MVHEVKMRSALRICTLSL